MPVYIMSVCIITYNNLGSTTYDLDIYIFNVASVDDDSLDELFNGLPARCLVLFEDIDAVHETHSW